ncbi:sensor histidine kinase (plasmid) [Sinorhizobium medicae]|nr:sensor histidine kinase [Sinorhizobium medicae]
MSAKARVGIVRVAGWIRLDSKTNDVEPPYDREITLIINNIDRLQMLGFLRPQEISLLHQTRDLVMAHIMPIAVSGRGYDQALRYADEVEENLARISDVAAVHRREVKEKEEFKRTLRRRYFAFVLILVVLISGAILITQNAEFEKRRNGYVRSVALLHSHMTRSRIAALRLFLDYFNDQRSPAPEMLRAALEAVKELEAINSGLVRIVNSERDAHTEALGELLQGIRVPLDTEIGLEIESNAKYLQVSAIQVHLIVEELVNNAVTAVAGKQTKQITIRARLLNRHFSFANKLLIQVADRGGGMTSDILDKAATPFFSTRAGSHVGLGLTSCIEMVKAMQGKVKIDSTPGVGTVVSVLLPLNQR